MRAVLDPNIFIAALLSRVGPPRRIVGYWLEGAFELVVSNSLRGELRQALEYPKLRDRIPPDESAKFVSLLAHSAILVPNAGPSRHRSKDPGDDYLLALAEAAPAILVSGDQHLLALGDELPIWTARAFLEALERG